MPIAIKCSCGKKYQAPENLAGKKIRCKACEASIPVPDEKTVDVEILDEDDAGEDDLPELPSAPRARRPAPRSKPARPVSRSRGSSASSSSSSNADADAHRAAEEQRESATRFATGMSLTGVACLVLPFFGVVVKGMTPEATWIIGGVLLVIGLATFAFSAFISVKPARRSSFHGGNGGGDDDDGDGATVSQRVTNPGELFAKIILWGILLVMLSIPALIFLAFGAGLMMAVGIPPWLVAIMVLLGIGGAIAGGIYWLIKRNQRGQPSARPRRRRRDEFDE